MRALAQDGGAIMSADRRVRDLMTTGVRTCGPDDTVKAVMAEMTRHRFRHMPVVEGGRLVGPRQHRRRGEDAGSTRWSWRR